MSTVGTHAWTRVETAAPPGATAALRAEWVKFWTVRSTPWSLAAMFLLGAGLTTLVCALSAEALARGDVGEPVGAFVTWGVVFAQVTAVVLGALVVTSEYGTGMIRATLAATPRRGAVLAAKAAVLASTLFVAQHAVSHVRVRSPQHDEVATLLRHQGLDVAAHGAELRVRGLDAAAVGELIGRSGLLLHELTLVRSSLEDAFMTLTADSVEYAGATR
jgi:hypothetical protein